MSHIGYEEEWEEAEGIPANSQPAKPDTTDPSGHGKQDVPNSSKQRSSGSRLHQHYADATDDVEDDDMEAPRSSALRKRKRAVVLDDDEDDDGLPRSSGHQNQAASMNADANADADADADGLSSAARLAAEGLDPLNDKGDDDDVQPRLRRRDRNAASSGHRTSLRDRIRQNQQKLQEVINTFQPICAAAV